MANYAGLHTGTQVYCERAGIQPYLAADGTLTGTTCHSIITDGTGNSGSLIINGATIVVIDGSQVDIEIATIGAGTLANACFLCTCFDCDDPDKGYTYPRDSIAYNYSGNTWIGGDGGRGMGGNSGGIRPVTRGSSDPSSDYTRLGIQGLRN